MSQPGDNPRSGTFQPFAAQQPSSNGGAGEDSEAIRSPAGSEDTRSTPVASPPYSSTSSTSAVNIAIGQALGKYQLHAAKAAEAAERDRKAREAQETIVDDDDEEDEEYDKSRGRTRGQSRAQSARHAHHEHTASNTDFLAAAAAAFASKSGGQKPPPSTPQHNQMPPASSGTPPDASQLSTPFPGILPQLSVPGRAKGAFRTPASPSGAGGSSPGLLSPSSALTMQGQAPSNSVVNALIEDRLDEYAAKVSSAFTAAEMAANDPYRVFLEAAGPGRVKAWTTQTLVQQTGSSGEERLAWNSEIRSARTGLGQEAVESELGCSLVIDPKARSRLLLKDNQDPDVPSILLNLPQDKQLEPIVDKFRLASPIAKPMETKKGRDWNDLNVESSPESSDADDEVDPDELVEAINECKGTNPAQDPQGSESTLVSDLSNLFGDPFAQKNRVPQTVAEPVKRPCDELNADEIQEELDTLDIESDEDNEQVIDSPIMPHPTKGYLLPPIVEPPLTRFMVYESVFRTYIVASDAGRTVYRLMKVERLTPDPTKLVLNEDLGTYDLEGIQSVLGMVAETARPYGGLNLVATGTALLGFVKFLFGYYLHLATQSQLVCHIGPHAIYTVTDSTLIPLWNPLMFYEAQTDLLSPQRKLYPLPPPVLRTKKHRTLEQKYRSLHQVLDLSKYFYYSHTYPLSLTLQSIIGHCLNQQIDRDAKARQERAKRKVAREARRNELRAQLPVALKRTSSSLIAPIAPESAMPSQGTSGVPDEPFTRESVVTTSSMTPQGEADASINPLSNGSAGSVQPVHSARATEAEIAKEIERAQRKRFRREQRRSRDADRVVAYRPPPLNPQFVWNLAGLVAAQTALGESRTDDSDNGNDGGGASFNRWFVALIHGFVEQVSFSVLGRVLLFTLISRRSRYFAGTRYLKRGLSDEGYVANEVETEQILWDRVGGHPTDGHFTSYVQLRASIPVPWTQDANSIVARPDIVLGQADPLYLTTRRHFEHLMRRYGAPVLALNLVKQHERRPRETLVGSEFTQAMSFLNEFLPEPYKFDYVAWDFKAIAKSKSLSVVDELGMLAHWSLLRTGFFHSHPRPEAIEAQATPLRTYKLRPTHSALATFLDEHLIERGHLHTGFVQRGIMRSNCIDSLDRTNVAQFCFGKCALGYQLHALGLTPSPQVSTATDLVPLLLEIYERMGDALALQYGGSAMHRQMKKDRDKSLTMAPVLYRQPPANKPKEMYVSLVRHYQNSFQDQGKQDAINLFLGCYAPSINPRAVQIWDLGGDYYLHNTSHAHSIAYAHTGKQCFATEDWWREPIRAFEQTLPFSWLVRDLVDQEPHSDYVSHRIALDAEAVDQAHIRAERARLRAQYLELAADMLKQRQEERKEELNRSAVQSNGSPQPEGSTSDVAQTPKVTAAALLAHVESAIARGSGLASGLSPVISAKGVDQTSSSARAVSGLTSLTDEGGFDSARAIASASVQSELGEGRGQSALSGMPEQPGGSDEDRHRSVQSPDGTAARNRVSKRNAEEYDDDDDEDEEDPQLKAEEVRRQIALRRRKMSSADDEEIGAVYGSNWSANEPSGKYPQIDEEYDDDDDDGDDDDDSNGDSAGASMPPSIFSPEAIVHSDMASSSKTSDPGSPVLSSPGPSEASTAAGVLSTESSPALSTSHSDKASAGKLDIKLGTIPFELEAAAPARLLIKKETEIIKKQLDVECESDFAVQAKANEASFAALDSVHDTKRVTLFDDALQEARHATTFVRAALSAEDLSKGGLRNSSDVVALAIAGDERAGSDSGTPSAGGSTDPSLEDVPSLSLRSGLGCIAGTTPLDAQLWATHKLRLLEAARLKGAEAAASQSLSADPTPSPQSQPSTSTPTISPSNLEGPAVAATAAMPEVVPQSTKLTSPRSKSPDSVPHDSPAIDLASGVLPPELETTINSPLNQYLLKRIAERYSRLEAWQSQPNRILKQARKDRRLCNPKFTGLQDADPASDSAAVLDEFVAGVATAQLAMMLGENLLQRGGSYYAIPSLRAFAHDPELEDVAVLPSVGARSAAEVIRAIHSQHEPHSSNPSSEQSEKDSKLGLFKPRWVPAQVRSLSEQFKRVEESARLAADEAIGMATNIGLERLGEYEDAGSKRPVKKRMPTSSVSTAIGMSSSFQSKSLSEQVESAAQEHSHIPAALELCSELAVPDLQADPSLLNASFVRDYLVATPNPEWNQSTFDFSKIVVPPAAERLCADPSTELVVVERATVCDAFGVQVVSETGEADRTPVESKDSAPMTDSSSSTSREEAAEVQVPDDPTLAEDMQVEIQNEELFERVILDCTLRTSNSKPAVLKPKPLKPVEIVDSLGVERLPMESFPYFDDYLKECGVIVLKNAEKAGGAKDAQDDTTKQRIAATQSTAGRNAQESKSEQDSNRHRPGQAIEIKAFLPPYDVEGARATARDRLNVQQRQLDEARALRKQQRLTKRRGYLMSILEERRKENPSSLWEYEDLPHIDPTERQGLWVKSSGDPLVGASVTDAGDVEISHGGIADAQAGFTQLASIQRAWLSEGLSVDAQRVSRRQGESSSLRDGDKEQLRRRQSPAQDSYFEALTKSEQIPDSIKSYVSCWAKPNILGENLQQQLADGRTFAMPTIESVSAPYQKYMSLSTYQWLKRM